MGLCSGGLVPGVWQWHAELRIGGGACGDDSGLIYKLAHLQLGAFRGVEEMRLDRSMAAACGALTAKAGCYLILGGRVET